MKKILVRLPNWLGDMVMSVAALHQIRVLYPGAEISVIVKKGLQDLLPFFPPLQHQFVFSKAEHPGLRGLWTFGQMIQKTERFDLFICFPDSLSSALMGFATGARQRIGFQKEGRRVFLTKGYAKPKGLHRVEEYLSLLELYSGVKPGKTNVSLQHAFPKEDYVVININSEASSRRLTTAKAVEIVEAARREMAEKIFLIGGPGEQPFVEDVLASVQAQDGIESLAGKTTLAGLAKILASAKAVLTTDSGPAHLANALGTQTVVLFGAGNENNTSPYNKEAAQVVRLGKLSCEPCTKNTCVQFGTPQCLELLDPLTIINIVNERKNHG